MNKNHSSAYNRDVSRRKALRKQRIAREIYYDGEEHPYYNNLHQYSKNKIHCSCPICSTKTRNKGHRRYKTKAGNFCRSINYGKSDLLKQIDMDEQMREAGFAAPQRRVKEWI